MNANWTWKAQGEANEYAVLDGGKWVAAIRLNGEMTVARQEQVMSGIVSVHDLVAVAQYVVDRAEWQRWDERDALLVMARAAIAKATGAEGAQQQGATLATDVEAACRLLEAKEYAEHWAITELGKRLEAALTAVHNDAAIQRDALHAVAEAVAEETTNWVANQHTLGVPNDAPDLDAIIDRVMAERGCL